MRRLILALATMAAALIPATAGAATLTATPATLSAQIAASKAGDTVQLAAGTYGTMTISGQTRATPVSIEPAAGANVTVGNITITNSSGWDVGGTGIAAPGRGITIKSSSNISVRNVAIGATSTEVVYMEGSSHILIKGVSAGPIQGADAIMIWPITNGATNADVTIDGVYVHDLDSDPSIDHQDCMQAASFDGLVVKNSRFINCYSQGLFVNPFSGATARNVTIENNFITYRTPAGRPAGGNALNIGDLTGGTMLIRNNTVNASPTIGVDEKPATSSARVTGNIFTEVSSFGCQTYAGRVDSFDHNVTSATCSGATNNTVASSTTIASQFVSGTDLHLKAGATAIGKASASDAPAADIDGQARDSAPDAGADEYNGGSTSVDTTAPETTIGTPPVDGAATSATFTFTASEAGSSFECRLDSSPYVACTSPKAYDNLAAGQHTVSVRATDIAGNTDQTPATASWTVTATADPCAQSKEDLADARAQIAVLQQQIADLTVSRDNVQTAADAYKARAEKAEDQVRRIRAITGE